LVNGQLMGKGCSPAEPLASPARSGIAGCFTAPASSLHATPARPTVKAQKRPRAATASEEATCLVDKIPRGTKLAEIPVQQPTQLRLVVNLKIAKALGLTIPASILLRADEELE